jgi:hypothetical protein
MTTRGRNVKADDMGQDAADGPMKAWKRKWVPMVKGAVSMTGGTKPEVRLELLKWVRTCEYARWCWEVGWI